MEVIIDNFDFWNCEAMRYFSFPKNYKDDKKIKAKELCYSDRYLGSRKMDGIWGMLIKDNNGLFHVRSRKKNVDGGFQDKAEWLPHICNNLFKIPNGTVLIGEIYYPDNEGSRQITTVFNCLKEKSLKRQEESGNLHFYIFDVLAYNGISLLNTPFLKRINDYLYKEILKLEEENNYIEVADYKKGKELWELYINIINEGGEGIVIQKEDNLYECGKKSAWKTLKLKKELQDTIDAFIDGNYKPPTRLYTGKELENWQYWENLKTNEKLYGSYFNEYTMSNSAIEPVTKAYFYNWSTSVSFSVMKDGKPTHIAWINGIPDILKQEIINYPNKWKNKVAELTAMELEMINGTYSLRHGRIEKWRDDKSYEECSYEQLQQGSLD